MHGKLGKFGVATAIIAAFGVTTQSGPARATEADTNAGIVAATLDAQLGKNGFFGANAAVQFSDGSRWFGSSGVTGPSEFGNGGRTLSIDDRFHIGSQTKTYTGTVILQYVDAGIIDLNQTVEDWLPDLTVMSETERRTITVKDLITQRSGIAEYLNGPDPNTPSLNVLDAWNAKGGQYDLSPSQLVEAGLVQPRTMTAGDPNTFSYSNTNFLLAGLIAERASCQTASGCQSFDQIVQEQILTPLQLNDTAYPTAIGYNGGQHTDATWNINGNYQDFTNTTPAVPNTAGAMYSTITDQLNWLVELTTNANGTLSAETFADRFTLANTLNGNVAGQTAGYGEAIYAIDSPQTGSRAIGHGGEISGTQTLMFRFEDSNVFVVADLNTFLSVPNDRTRPATDINELYYAIERSISIMSAASTSNGGCPASATGMMCSGTSVTTSGLSSGGTIDIEASGSFWTNRSLTFSEAVPTVVAYGDGVVGLTATDATVNVKQNAILETIGNNSRALALGGSANNVTVSGTVTATGSSTTAIDGSASSNDTVTVASTGTVNGDIKLTAGTDRLTMNGTMTGDVTTGANTTVSGTGSISGMISGSGAVSPGNSVGTLTVTRYEASGGTLNIEVDGTTGTADKLVVNKQTSNGFDVVDTGAALLSGGSLNLSGTALKTDARTVVVDAGSSVTGSFSSVSDPAGLLNDQGRVTNALLSGSGSVMLASLSPAPLDAIADMSYLSAADTVDQAFGRLADDNSRLDKADYALGYAGGLGTFAEFDSVDQVSGYSIRTGGLAAGIDFAIGDDAMAGVFLSTTSESAHIDNGGGDQDGKIATFGIEGDYAFGDYHLSGLLGFGFGTIEHERSLTVDGSAEKAEADIDHRRIMAGLRLSRAFDASDWRIESGGSLFYMNGRDDSFSESGVASNAALTYDSRSYDRLRVGVDTRVSSREPVGGVLPWVSAGLYQHLDLTGSDSAAHLSGGAPVTLEGRDNDGLEARLGVGFTHQLTDQIHMNFGIAGGLRDDNGSGTVSLRFTAPLGG